MQISLHKTKVGVDNLGGVKEIIVVFRDGSQYKKYFFLMGGGYPFSITLFLKKIFRDAQKLLIHPEM